MTFDSRPLTRALIEEATDRLFKNMGGPSRTFPPEILKDSLVPQLGNRLAYQQVETELKDNVHVLINMDDVGVVNDAYGHDHGDRLIQVAGEILAKLSGTHEGQGFRLYGDTFLFAFPEADQANEFVRDAGEEFKGLVPVGAYGMPSFAAGLGMDMADAEDALEKAKQAKRHRYGDRRVDLAADVGHGICYIHTNLGYGGAIPVSEEPEIPQEFLTPKTSLPMELREEASPVVDGPEAEDVVKSESLFSVREQRTKRAQVPDFARDTPQDD
jgi:GGDEF domain-containing protein